jgi:hypothetical protein
MSWLIAPEVHSRGHDDGAAQQFGTDNQVHQFLVQDTKNVAIPFGTPMTLTAIASCELGPRE